MDYGCIIGGSPTTPASQKLPRSSSGYPIILIKNINNLGKLGIKIGALGCPKILMRLSEWS
jgi:hypothetical protein